MPKTVEQYLETLRRLPPDVVLELAGRELNLVDADACLCGTAVRVTLARQTGVDLEDVAHVCGITYRAVELFGGNRDEWSAVFYGVVGLGPCGQRYSNEDNWGERTWAGEPTKIEEALAIRLDEVVMDLALSLV